MYVYKLYNKVDEKEFTKIKKTIHSKVAADLGVWSPGKHFFFQFDYVMRIVSAADIYRQQFAVFKENVSNNNE